MSNMHKYREALEYLADNCYEYDYDEDINGDWIDYYTPSGEDEYKILKKALDKLELYKKALDKACDELVKLKDFYYWDTSRSFSDMKECKNYILRGVKREKEKKATNKKKEDK